jgi:hypothetical protein
MRHLALRLAAVLAAEDETTRWLLAERLIRDTRPARRRAVQSVLWC